jgi:hypothetical protein
VVLGFGCDGLFGAGPTLAENKVFSDQRLPEIATGKLRDSHVARKSPLPLMRCVILVLPRYLTVIVMREGATARWRRRSGSQHKSGAGWIKWRYLVMEIRVRRD